MYTSSHMYISPHIISSSQSNLLKVLSECRNDHQNSILKDNYTNAVLNNIIDCGDVTKKNELFELFAQDYTSTLKGLSNTLKIKNLIADFELEKLAEFIKLVSNIKTLERDFSNAIYIDIYNYIKKLAYYVDKFSDSSNTFNFILQKKNIIKIINILNGKVFKLEQVQLLDYYLDSVKLLSGYHSKHTCNINKIINEKVATFFYLTEIKNGSAYSPLLKNQVISQLTHIGESMYNSSIHIDRDKNIIITSSEKIKYLEFFKNKSTLFLFVDMLTEEIKSEFNAFLQSCHDCHLSESKELIGSKEDINCLSAAINTKVLNHYNIYYASSEDAYPLSFDDLVLKHDGKYYLNNLHFEISKWLTICLFSNKTRELFKVKNHVILSNSDIFFCKKNNENDTVAPVTLTSIQTIDIWTWPRSVSFNLLKTLIAETNELSEFLYFLTLETNAQNILTFDNEIKNCFVDKIMILATNSSKSKAKVNDFLNSIISTLTQAEIINNVYFNLFSSTPFSLVAFKIFPNDNDFKISLIDIISAEALSFLDIEFIEKSFSAAELNIMLNKAKKENSMPLLNKVLLPGLNYDSSKILGMILNTALYNSDETLSKRLLNIELLDVNFQDELSLYSPAIIAAEKDNSNFLRAILDHKSFKSSNLYVKNVFGDTILLAACRNGSEGTLRYILGFNNRKLLSIRDKNENNGLHLAVVNQNLNNVIQILDCNYLDLNGKNTYGETPLMLAAKYGNHEILKLLLNSNINLSNNHGYSALHFAAKYGHHRCVEELIYNKANVNKRNIKLRTPLILAARQGNYTSIEVLLLCHQININTKDITNKSAIDYVNCNHFNKCKELLLEYRARNRPIFSEFI